jgi:hypothetical protein
MSPDAVDRFDRDLIAGLQLQFRDVRRRELQNADFLPFGVREFMTCQDPHIFQLSTRRRKWRQNLER